MSPRHLIALSVGGALACVAGRASESQAALFTNFAEYGTTVNGFQDDFDGTTLNPGWLRVDPGNNDGGNVYTLSGDGRLLMGIPQGDGNRLLYNGATYSTSSQEVLALMRSNTAPPANNLWRFGVAGLTNTSNGNGINLELLGNENDAPNLHARLLNDNTAWSPTFQSNAWTVGGWYWVRIQATQNGAINAKVWSAGTTPEPTAFTFTWSGQNRSGLAGLANAVNGLGGDFQVDYVLIKASGLPSINIGNVPEPATGACAMAAIGAVAMTLGRRTRRVILAPAIAAIMLLAFALPARSATITPTNATASSWYTGTTARVPTKTIDSSGLNGNGAHDSNADLSMWLSNGNVDNDGMPDITWDLGDVYTVTGLHLWNYNPADSNPLWRSGVKETTILTSMTGAAGSYTALPGTFTFTGAPGADGYLGEDYSLPTFSARYVKFDIISNFGGLDQFPDIIRKAVGISEIRFQGGTVPEPASLSLVALAASVLGLRRR